MLHQIRKALSAPSRFKRDVLWNYASLAVLGCSGIFINGIILAKQGAQSLGIFNQVFAFFIIISQFSVGGLQFSALKHCSYEQDHLARCSLIVSTALLLTATAGMIVCPVLFFLRNVIGEFLASPAVAMGIAFMAPGLFFFSLNKVLIMTLNGLRHMRAFALFQASRYILIFIGVSTIIMMGYPGSYLALALTFAEIILFIALMAYITTTLFPIRFAITREAKEWFRRHLSFGIRGMLSGVLIETNTRMDVLLLGCFLSDASVGVYSFGATFAEGFAQLSVVMRQNIDPLLGKAFAEQDNASIEKLARKMRKIFYPIMIVLGLILIVGFPGLLWGLQKVSLYPDVLLGSWGVFAILVTGTVIGAGYRPFIALILQGGRPGTFTLLMLGSVLANVALNLSLIPFLGIYGSASATAMVYVLEACAIVVLARKIFGIRL